MFPIVVDVAAQRVVLVGQGADLEKRLALLEAAGAHALSVFAEAPDAEFRERLGARFAGPRPTEKEIASAALLFVAGLGAEESERLAGIARANGTLVNVEDVKPLCDFHVPSQLRRGDLLISISTNGKSPGLARYLKAHLERLIGPEWAGRLDEVAERREAWRAEGLALREVSRRVSAYIDEKGWLS